MLQLAVTAHVEVANEVVFCGRHPAAWTDHTGAVPRPTWAGLRVYRFRSGESAGPSRCTAEVRSGHQGRFSGTSTPNS